MGALSCETASIYESHTLALPIDAESADHRHWNAWGNGKGPSADRAASAGLKRLVEGGLAGDGGRSEGSGSIEAEDIGCSRYVEQVMQPSRLLQMFSPNLSGLGLTQRGLQGQTDCQL